ncbi:MAG: hypothetical protein RKO24_04180, partial [Candidatus Competibacter sp.]|nr:hypothetical protein [Candidatus Competibacter sp.]
MAISSRQIADRVHLVTLSGLLTWTGFQTFLSQVEAGDVFASGKVRILIQLENFAGWEPGEQSGQSHIKVTYNQWVDYLA